jgi:hypothetical protein
MSLTDYNTNAPGQPIASVQDGDSAIGRTVPWLRFAGILLFACALVSCASLSGRDPLNINVAGIEPLPGEGLELRLQVSIRVLNPNDAPVSYSGAALDLFLNDRRLASGVSDATGSVPRYGESVLTIPVTISAFDVARQLLGFISDGDTTEFRYRIKGKLEGGIFGTRRFEDEGSVDLNLNR